MRFDKAFNRSLYNITQAEIVARISVSDNKTKNIIIRLTWPNSCSLKYTDLDIKLRQMLVESGLEPKEPEKPDVA